MSVSPPFRPHARFDDLVINQVEREMLVFDQRSNHIHQLDAVCAATWQLCDGQRGASELARLVSRGLGEPVAVEAIDLALEQLSEAGLLLEAKAATGPRASRRSLLRQAAVGGALAVPAIVSISAPQAAAAQSCDLGVTCQNDDVCCLGGVCDGAGHCCSFGEVCSGDGVCCSGGSCDVNGNCCLGGQICQTDDVCCLGGICDISGRCCSGGIVCPADNVCCSGGTCDDSGNCCGLGYMICDIDRVCCLGGMCVDGMCAFP